MLILGIETSCDETAACLLEARPIRNSEENQKFLALKDSFNKSKAYSSNTNISKGIKFKILSNVISSQIKIHQKYGGVVPEKAARKHLETILLVIKQALLSPTKHYKISEIIKKIDCIAVTIGPGLITSLLIGIETAKTLAYVWRKPVIGINHLEGHIYANWLMPVSKISNFQFLVSKQIQSSKTYFDLPASEEGFQIQKIQFPVLCLIVSGGHTELILMKGHGQYRKISQTRDDAAGETFDKAAKLLGLGYPGGPAVAARAAKILDSRFQISDSRFQISLPRPMIDSNNFDFSFSGLKTALLYKIREDKNWRKKIPEYCHELQQAIIDVLIKKTISAAKKYKVKTVLLAGGVAANKELHKQLTENIKKDLPTSNFQSPTSNLCTDNAAMIACTGYFHAIKKDFTPWWKLKVDPNLKL